MKGKEKCKALKEIRQKIAEQNDIAFAVSECTHQGDCKGTCPKCEAELRYLERQLEIRQNLGKAVVVAGISAGICAPLTACNPIEAIGDVIADVYYSINPEEIGGETQPPEDLAGDVEYIPPSDEIDGGIEEYDPGSEDIVGMEGENPDLEYDPNAETAGAIPSEEPSIEIEVLEGDVVIDPEFLDEE